MCRVEVPLAVGRIVKPHGVRGELKVSLYWQQSEALFTSSAVWLRGPSGEQRHLVAGARRTGRGVLLRLAEVNDADAAEALRGHEVLVNREDCPLAPGEYFLVDLVGLPVALTTGEPVGTIVEVRTYSTVDVAVLTLGDGRRVEQPLVEPWLARVDLDERVVELTSTDGFIE